MFFSLFKIWKIKYGDKNIQIDKAYESKGKSLLVRLVLNCDKRYNTPSETYFISLEGKTVSLGRGYLLIDAGDYDNDGHSEFIFFGGGYNRDGYTMYYNNFTKKVEHSWKYH